jgi:predicted GNAT superfamily acetyltransferase
VILRDITTIDECRQVAALERDVWGYVDGEDVVPPPVLIVSVKRGGILIGAYDAAETLKAFVYSIPAIKDGRLSQWSHMLGVAPDARGAGLGMRLKLAQRARALAMGADLIEWTYDPLQALNAHLNFSKLGVVVEEYEENIYGASSSPLHAGSPTDRFVAEWKLTAPHVERRIAAGGIGIVRDAAVASAPLVNPSATAGKWLKPSEPDLSLAAPRLLIEIPAGAAGYDAMQRENPPLALEWRTATRAMFQHYLSRRYRVVDFFLSMQAGRGQYLLSLVK